MVAAAASEASVPVEMCIRDSGSNGGAAVVGSQSTDDEDAQHGSCTGELLSVGSQDVDSLGRCV